MKKEKKKKTCIHGFLSVVLIELHVANTDAAVVPGVTTDMQLLLLCKGDWPLKSIFTSSHSLGPNFGPTPCLVDQY